MSFDNAVYLYRVADNGNEVVLHRAGSSGIVCRMRLPKGVYRVDGNISKINFQAESAATTEQEWNDSFDTANEIETNIVYIGNLNLYYYDYSQYYNTYDIDYFKFELPQGGTVRVQYFMEELGYSRDSSRNNLNTITLYTEDEDFNVKKICTIGSVGDYKTKYSNRYRLPK